MKTLNVRTLFQSLLWVLALVVPSMTARGDDWGPGFHLPGVNRTVLAMAEDADAVYYGGNFSAIGAVPANGIARVDKITGAVLPLGAGVKTVSVSINAPAGNGTVNALAIAGTDLYAGGNFITADGVTVNRVARWDGAKWSALGVGFNTGEVKALAMMGGSLYAGGAIYQSGGTVVGGVARWTGTEWAAVGTGVTGTVRAFAVVGTDLYAAGSFQATVGAPRYGIAKWDGSTWSYSGSLPLTDAYEVRALAVSGGTLYAGGFFPSIDGAAATKNVACWIGGAWSAVGDGFADGAVETLVANGGGVDAGGNFTASGAVAATGVARWDGAAWHALGSGTDGTVRAMTAADGVLRIGGDFARAGDAARPGAARWDGTQWADAIFTGPGRGANDVVRALVDGGSVVYAGGAFTTVGGVLASRVAAWDKTTHAWSALGAGLDGQVNALAMMDGGLYAAGDFTQSGGTVVGTVAKWTGAQWVMVGGGIFSHVSALAVMGSDLFAGGKFTLAGGVAANNIARWDGGAWHALGQGVELPYLDGNAVDALLVSGTSLYVGGDFAKAGGATAKNVALWDGSAWTALGSNLGKYSGQGVRSLAIFGGLLYAGGGFTLQENLSAISDNLATWNGTAWVKVGANGAVYALTTTASSLYIGGAISTVGGASGANLPYSVVKEMTLSGSSSLGGSMVGTALAGEAPVVYSLAPVDGYVMAGGSFIKAGSFPAQNVAAYGAAVALPPTLTPLGPTGLTADTATLRADVNPNGAETTVTFEYGVDSTYGSQLTGSPASLTGSASASVTGALTGLTPRQLYHFRVRASNAAGETVGWDQTFRACTPLEAWRYLHFGTYDDAGPAADLAQPAGDGVPNLLKYATGKPPYQNTPEMGRLQRMTGYITLPGGASSAGAYLQFSFNRIEDPALIYSIEATEDLGAGGWTEIWSSTGIQNTASAVTVLDVKSTKDIPRRFMRLKVSN